MDSPPVFKPPFQIREFSDQIFFTFKDLKDYVENLGGTVTLTVMWDGYVVDLDGKAYSVIQLPLQCRSLDDPPHSYGGIRP